MSVCTSVNLEDSFEWHTQQADLHPSAQSTPLCFRDHENMKLNSLWIFRLVFSRWLVVSRNRWESFNNGSDTISWSMQRRLQTDWVCFERSWRIYLVVSSCTQTLWECRSPWLHKWLWVTQHVLLHKHAKHLLCCYVPCEHHIWSVIWWFFVECD